MASFLIWLFFHDLEHHSGSQTKAVLEQMADFYALGFPYAVGKLGEQSFLFLCQSLHELFFDLRNLLTGFSIFLTRYCGIFYWLDITIL